MLDMLYYQVTMVSMKTVAVPKYERVKQQITRGIETGRWVPGALFPSEAQLLKEFDVSRPTLVRALQELANDGYLHRRQGKGTYVARRRSEASGIEDSHATIHLFISRDVAGFTGATREVQLRILRGVEHAAGDAAFGVAMRQASLATIDAATRRLIEIAPPSIALVIEPAFSPQLPVLLEERGWTVWSINEPVEEGNCVLIDQEHAGYLATRFLLDEGRRRIALLNGPVANYWGFAARRNGYERALREAGLEPDPRWVLEGQHAIDSEAGRAMMADLLKRGGGVQGVVGASDSKTIGAMAHAIEQGLSIPEDLGFVSIDNTLADQAPLPLPAVAMPFEEMGYQAAVQALHAHQRRDTPTLVHTRMTLRPTLLER